MIKRYFRMNENDCRGYMINQLQLVIPLKPSVVGGHEHSVTGALDNSVLYMYVINIIHETCPGYLQKE